MRNLGILFGGAIALAACSTTPRPVVDPTNPLFAPGYMAQAASADQAEIQSGQLALQASQNAGVRNFANMIIADHTRSSQMIASSVMPRSAPPYSAGIMRPARYHSTRCAGGLIPHWCQDPKGGRKPSVRMRSLRNCSLFWTRCVSWK